VDSFDDGKHPDRFTNRGAYGGVLQPLTHAQNRHLAEKLLNPRSDSQQKER
jgi:hypothetical protein